MDEITVRCKIIREAIKIIRLQRFTLPQSVDACFDMVDKCALEIMEENFTSPNTGSTQAGVPASARA